MRFRFGLLTLLGIVALTAVGSWYSWKVSPAHGDPSPMPREVAEQFGVELQPGIPLITSSTIYGVPFFSHQTIHFWPPYERPSVDIVHGWGAAGNVLVSLALTCITVFGVRAIWDWWHTYTPPRSFSRRAES